MIITKILNNNVAVVVNAANEEMIVMGRGITYKKSNGDYLLREDVDKIYKLTNTDNFKDIQDLFLNIPIDIIDIGGNIFSYASETLGEKLKESNYIFIADHIYQSINRFKEGIKISNGLLWEIKKFYKVHYDIGQYALALIKEKLNVELPDDEAGFIALHILNSELDDKTANIQKITVMIHEISNIVLFYYGKKFDEDSASFYRFVMHLKFFALRVFQGKKNTFDNGDIDIFNLVKSKYQNSYACVEKIAQFIENQYNYIIDIDEKMYLTIHIERIVSK